MPLVRLQTNAAISPPQQRALLGRLSAAAAELLGKPESYVMVILQPELPMLMAREGTPAALVEVDSVGSISPETARGLTGRLGDILGEELAIEAERIYAIFAGVDGASWGWNGETFG